MSKKEFNIHSTAPIRNSDHSYEIEPIYPKEWDFLKETQIVSGLKNDIRDWVLKTTGCDPSVEVLPFSENERPVPLVHIHCTPAFIKKLADKFGDRIAKITRIATRDEIILNGGPGCWEPPSPKA